jgi:predicted nuclease with TOPRIM domain
VATPQDNIIEALETEVIRLKFELSHTEDKYLAIKKKFDELKVRWKNQHGVME